MKILAAAIGVLVIAFSGWKLFSSVDLVSPVSDRNAQRNIASTGAADGLIERGKFLFDPRQGQRFEYRFKRKIEIKGFAQGLPPIVYDGGFWVEILSNESEDFSFLIGQKIHSLPQNEVYLLGKANKSGRILFLYSKDRKNSQEEQNEAIAKDLVSLLFFFENNDTFGNYTATYSPLPDLAGFLRARKQKTAYQINRGRSSLPLIISSNHIIKWNSFHRMPEEVNGREESAVSMAKNMKVESSSYYSIELRNVTMANMPANSYADLNVPSQITVAGSRNKNSQNRELIAWDEVSKKLRLSSTLAGNRKLEIFGELLKFIQQDKKNIKLVLSFLYSESSGGMGAESSLFQSIIGALASDGSDESQKALLEVFSDPRTNHSGKGAILSALTTTQANLNENTREFLSIEMNSEEDKDLSAAAAFAFGSSLQAGNTLSAYQKNQVAQYWERAKGASFQERLTALDVIGNSGKSEFFPILREVFESSQENDLRAKAIFSLRFMKSSEAVDSLVYYVSHADPALRSAAVFAMGFSDWNESFRSPLEKCANNEVDFRIKMACSETLTKRSGIVAQVQ